MSLKTDNFELFKYEDSDIADLRFLHGSMDIIDKGINPFYVASLDSANTYKVTTGLNKTVLNDGYSIKVAIPSNSTGAVSIIIDNCSAIALKQPNGSTVSNLKANGVYSLTYYNSVFILASGGGADTVNFSASDLLTGKSANNSNGEKVDGTMVNHGAKTATLNCGGTYNIPAGYHNGSGKVTANSLATQMANNGVTLTSASQLISGVKAYSKTGQLLTGTATIQSLGGKNYYKYTISDLKTAGLAYKEEISSTHYNYYLNLSSLNIGFTPKIIIGYFTRVGSGAITRNILSIIDSEQNINSFKNIGVSTSVSNSLSKLYYVYETPQYYVLDWYSNVTLEFYS